ncbi:MAG: RnfABCDGE type electron transport complex subunit D [Clostridia bacterium]|nr:RnfABCDGE type electron transport complex subunit D [Clostridia bacterium]
MANLHVSSTPHIHQKGSSTRNIMLDVVIALIPATIAGVVIFGLSALWVILACVASAVLAEYVFNLCCKRKQTIGDLSAVVTGLLLALNLRADVPIWQCVVGSVFAIIVVKCFFGGLGKNIANPAITARVFMLLTFATTVGGGAAPVADLTASASPLVTLNQGAEAASSISLLTLFLGTHAGAIGETCVIALLLGFAYLVIRKVIKWYVPASFVATVFVCYFLFGGFDVVYSLQHVLAGGLLLGAIFMATDYVTTPATNLGRVVFCIGAGLLTFAIRSFGAYPEGVSIAILTMNLLTPFIADWTKNKTLGGVR